MGRWESWLKTSPTACCASSPPLQGAEKTGSRGSTAAARRYRIAGPRAKCMLSLLSGCTTSAPCSHQPVAPRDPAGHHDRRVDGRATASSRRVLRHGGLPPLAPVAGHVGARVPWRVLKTVSLRPNGGDAVSTRRVSYAPVVRSGLQ